MKRLLLLLPALLALHTAQGQFGLKAGANAAVLDGKINESTRYKTYYHAGLLYQYKLIGPVSLQPELLYSLQGTETKSDFENYDTKLHYLTLPILAKVSVGPVFVEGGPQFGVLLTARDAGTMLVSAPGTTAQYGSTSRQVEDNFKKGDFSLCAGAGLKLGPVLLGGRFNAGINDINDVKNVSGVNDAKLHNRVFQAYVAVQLGDD
ncbi:Outer membrane protein beta-barrel domain-containing protein [Hymenobacter daecheongensis DSM 21074]|uniref:Outer membrane protein beta-barrel domain-containing protein n=1 Tax=Hymenobacter daecheongensis DSM 21074 TaxID=1121955 RepID=A0A1M6IU04_9BACT|nr:porin family protein [Hymenobacter daecheongensis]SHJ37918.1 Outer membrane protein beta-barrel domain-containing protein [Hymenobacter daecheongensis DSM 21074]